MGNVIVKKKGQNTLHKFQVQTGYAYQKIWTEESPHDVNTAKVIGISEHGQAYLQEKSGSPTLVMDSAGKNLLTSWHYEGTLLTCLPSNQPVYAVEKADGEYEIVKVEIDSSEVRLQPVSERPAWPHPYLSVCDDERRSRIAVTSKLHTLDIYSRDRSPSGKIREQVSKSYCIIRPEVNLPAFVYRLFHEDFSSIDGSR